MRVRIQNSSEFIQVDVEYPYLLGDKVFFEENIKPKLQGIIDKNNLKCDGCGKHLEKDNWLCVQHRPKSADEGFKEALRIENEEEALSYIDYKIKDIWAYFLFCFDTRDKCIKKWSKRRPK